MPPGLIPADGRYYRPIPQPPGWARYRLAGGWMGFSEFEVLQRGQPPYRTDDCPPEILARLTTPRTPVAGISVTKPLVMGIVNATPDSFSDGGTYDPGRQGAALQAAGADMLDIGGESTRPGATEVPAADEIARIVPVIAALAGRLPISIDTRKAAVAAAALDQGGALVNDVSGLSFDVDMAGLVAARGVPVCVMHARGLPATMQDDPRYGDVILDVYDALAARIGVAEATGIPRSRIIVDPGIGFGKTAAHNLAILRRISVYHGLGCTILLGLSRKAFIGSIGRAPEPAGRAAGTLALTLDAVAQGVQIHRVHDVAEVAQGLRLWQALHDNDGTE